jgi:hypothetical protein
MLKKSFEQNKGAKVQIKTSAIRLFNDVAWQDGTAMLTFANAEEENSPFTAVWTKKDGKWLLNLVRDQTNQPVKEKPAPPHLKDLSWLIGDWIHENKDNKTTLSARWMHGEKFIICDLEVFRKGEETLSMTQFIGWDPTGDRLHSWLFDSRGGFGEGYWNRKGSTWIVHSAGVTTDGKEGTGTMIWKNVDANSFMWEGTDRHINGHPLPDVKVTYQRVKKSK